jgi:hypothetical protein
MTGSHDTAFAEFRARREENRAREVKVTWRKVSPMTGGGWSALGRDGALGFVNPKRASGFEYGLRDGRAKPVTGVALTLARAKRAVEQLLTESACKPSLAPREETSIVRVVNNVQTHLTGGTSMKVQVKHDKILVGGEVVGHVTPAAFLLPGPNKWRAEIGDPAKPETYRVEYAESKQAAVAAVTTPTTEATASRKEATVAATSIAKGTIKSNPAEAITAEEFVKGIDGVEAVRAAKTPTARLRASGKTLAYADDRKDGFVLSIAAEAVEGAPKTVAGKLEIKGRRATMHVTGGNAKGAATVIAWLAKQVA